MFFGEVAVGCTKTGNVDARGLPLWNHTYLYDSFECGVFVLIYHSFPGMVGPALPLFMFQPPNWNPTKEIERELMEEFLARENALNDAEDQSNPATSDWKPEGTSVCNVKREDKEKEVDPELKPPADEKDPLVEEPPKTGSRKKIPPFPKKPFDVKAEIFVPLRFVLLVYFLMLNIQQTWNCGKEGRDGTGRSRWRSADSSREETNIAQSDLGREICLQPLVDFCQVGHERAGTQGKSP